MRAGAVRNAFYKPSSSPIQDFYKRAAGPATNLKRTAARGSFAHPAGVPGQKISAVVAPGRAMRPTFSWGNR
jgi:hypothetical protein